MLGVYAEEGAVGAEGVDRAHIQPPTKVERCVEGKRRMSLREDDAVAVVPTLDAGLLDDRSDQVCNRESRSDVTHPGPVGLFDDRPTDVVGETLPGSNPHADPG